MTETPVLPTWKKILFSVVAAVLLVGVLELAANVYLRTARGYTGGDLLQYQFDPYRNIRLTPSWTDSRGARHNAQGFRRDGDVALVKPEGTFRVFLMGASTAYGLGGLWPHIQSEFAVLDNTETIDAYLEQILASRMPSQRVEVINAAVPSIWTHHHLIRLNQEILKYSPDLVLFLDGFNDHFAFNRSHDQFASYVQTEQATVIMGEPTLRALVRMNAWWWFRRSALVHVAVRAAEGLKPAFRDRGVRRPIDVERAMSDLQFVFNRNALKMMERSALILRHEDIPSIFLLQPLLALERSRIEARPEVERRLFEFNLEAWLPGYEDLMLDAAPWVAARMQERLLPLGADVVDLTGVFEGTTEQMFTDYAHLTPVANRLVAHAIAERVIEQFGPARAGARRTP